MSNLRYNARRDANEKAIIKALEQAGASVVKINGRDLPDLLVGYRGIDFQIEVKSAGGSLTEGQDEHIRSWRGRPVTVVKTRREALAAIGAIAQ